MSRVAYVNGAYVPHADAAVHVEDRGYQFSDGIYEVVAVRNGLPVDFELHYQRMCRGLSELSIEAPMRRAALVVVLKQMIRRNRIINGILYWQITRGVSPRNHPFPAGIRPSLVVTAKAGMGPSQDVIDKGVSVLSVEDIRWGRRDIKSISLLPNVLAKEKAHAAGCFEAFQVMPDGTISEAGASNAWIVSAEGVIITRQLGPEILPGITRHVVIELARKAGYAIHERPFTLEEAKSAREAFITSTTSYVMPVVQVDDTVIGNGAPGSVATGLRALYVKHVAGLTAQTAWAE